MRHLILLVLFSSLFLSAYPQKVLSDKGEVKDLKEISGKYTQITIQGAINKLSIGVETNLEGYWRFCEEETRKEIKFNSHVDLMNFMYKNGWIFKQFIQADSAPVANYIFEKKD